MPNRANLVPRRIGSVLLAASFLAIVVAALPAAAQALVKVNDDINFKVGMLLQAQADWQEVPNAKSDGSGGFQQNMLVRRARFILGGQIAKNVVFFVETENANLGKTTVGGNTPGTAFKNPGSGFNILDAAGEWRIAKQFNIQFGEIIAPVNRWITTSSSATFMLDQSAYNVVSSTALQNNTGRDTGVMFRGYFFCDRLEYRSGIFGGLRQTGVRNSPRFTEWLQWNFFDTEVYNLPGYVGVNYGNRKILAVGGAYDTQSDYKLGEAHMFLDFPIPVGSFESTIFYQYINGGTFITSLPEENTFSVETGLFLKGVKLAPIVRYEQKTFNQAVNEFKNENRYAVGLNFYPFPKTGNAFNLKFWWQKVIVKCAVNPGSGACPTASSNFGTDQFTLQMQIFYF